LAKKGYGDKSLAKNRLGATMLILSFVFFLLFAKMFYVMVIKAAEYKSLAIAQWTSDLQVDAKRGRILDRNGNELAVSANVYRVDLDLTTLRETMQTKKLTTDDVAVKIATALGMEAADVKEILNRKQPNGKPITSAILKRRIEKEQADKVSALKLRGILISSDTKRYYPNGNFLAQVLGHTNSDGAGLTGVELQYNKVLAGTPGQKVAEIDRKSEDLPYESTVYKAPVDGKDLVLTVDEVIQNIAEKLRKKPLRIIRQKQCP
jgi:stage V sporulation protein D (sporulation-specific penicillin-binding protein)